MPDEVTIGGNRWANSYLTDEQALTVTIPPPPVFDEDMESVIARVKKMVAKASIPKSLAHPHRLIAQLLEEDEARRQKKTASWDTPIFDTPFEQRPLKILNGIFTGVEQCGMKASFSGKQARELHVMVGETNVSFSLDSMQAEKQLERERSGYAFMARGAHDKMRLNFSNWRFSSKSDKSWQDSDAGKIEKYLQEIVEQLIITGEQYCRGRARGHHAWLIERKQSAEEDVRKRKAEEERKRREYEKKLEKQRVDYLLGQSMALRQAGEIRAYVEAVLQANATSNNPMPQQEFEQWTKWALAQADHIDPIRSGQYRMRLQEPEEIAAP